MYPTIARPVPYFDAQAAFRAFDEALERFLVEPTYKDGKPYVLVQSLIEWLRGAWPEHKVTQAERLHKAVYHHSDNKFNLITPDQLSAEQNRCLIVFSILLSLRKGRLVDSFQRRGIVDRRLPMMRDELLGHIKAMVLSDGDAEELANAFFEKQWMFCPVTFFRDMRMDYEAEYIFPICQMQKINEKGGSATGIYLIEVQEQFVYDDLRQAAKRYNNKKDKFGNRYQFALKAFGSANKDLFSNEIEAFRALQGHDGMVKCLGSYRYGAYDSESQDESDATANILLEYGDLDLDEYFFERLPPVFPDEILRFWRELFDVGYAIKGVHNVRFGKGELEEEFYGWHADIKPDNILSVQGEFKLADPGFAHFVKKTDEIPMGEILGGTETYGAPECHPSRRRLSSMLHQTIDIWSLGCVLSIAATWVAIGYQGIRQYSEFRKKALKNVKYQNVSEDSSQSDQAHSNDYFHNGHDILPEVTSWHKSLKMILRKTDTTTALVLDLIDERMLLSDPLDRISAEELCLELRAIVQKSETAQFNLGEVVPEMIVEGLRQLDDSAPAKAPSKPLSDQSSPDSHSRSEKVKRLEVPLMKTAHRSEYFKAELSRPSTPPEKVYAAETTEIQDGVQKKIQHIPMRDSGIQGFSPASSPPGQLNTSPDRPYSIASTYEMSLQSSAAPSMYSNKSPTASQDVFQTRQRLDQSEKGFRALARKAFGKSKKDVLLSQYYDNRDIVFVVDNAATMQEHWDKATFVLETLVKLSAGQDRDGADLHFALGSHKLEGKKNAKAFSDAMRHRNARPGSEASDIRKPLGTIFEAYLEAVRKAKSWGSKLKKLTIIVLTDGLWEGVQEKGQVDEQIVTFLQRVKEQTIDLVPRRVSIAFVQFGNDPNATARLNHLDKFLKARGIEDVIDTVPSDGDTYKMLLGSFVENFDGDAEQGNSPHGYHEGPSNMSNSTLDSPTSYSSPSQTRFGPPIRSETSSTQRTVTPSSSRLGQSQAYSTTGSLRRNRSQRHDPNSG